jgi:cell shape-determining protein MreD
MMHGSATSSAALVSPAAAESAHTVAPSSQQLRPLWLRLSLIAFACVYGVAIGIFFAVFIGVVISPIPRSALCMAAAGGFAFAVLAMSQFAYWSWLLLRTIKGRAKA